MVKNPGFLFCFLVAVFRSLISGSCRVLGIFACLAVPCFTPNYNLQSRKEEEDDLAREDWEEDIRQHRQAGQQAQEAADQCSVKIIELLYTMAAGSARQVGTTLLLLLSAAVGLNGSWTWSASRHWSKQALFFGWLLWMASGPRSIW